MGLNIVKQLLLYRNLRVMQPIITTRLNTTPKLIYLNKLRYCTNQSNNNDEIDEYLDDKLNIRNILYKNCKDPLVHELNECASVQHVFNIIRNNNENMNDVQVSQAVLVLWDLQKIFYKHNINCETDDSSDLNPNAILKKYISQVSGHEDFTTLIRLINKNYEKFSLDALTCSLLYLHRMGVSLKSNVMRDMMSRCENEIKKCDKNVFPLSALSRFIVTIYHQEDLYAVLVRIDALTIVLQRLVKCVNEEDFKLLTICLYRMRQLIVMDNIETYKNVTNKLIDEKKLTEQNGRTILKALRFLTCFQWGEYNIQCTNRLMHLLKNSISQFDSRELLMIFKIFQMQKEPGDMLEELQEHALYQISNLQTENDTNFEIILELLSCVVLFSYPSEKPKFEGLARRYIDNNLSTVALNALYKIMYHIKTMDGHLCNKFWDKSYKNIIKNSLNEDEQIKNILNLCLKYIHFSQDIGHKYRYFQFEEILIDRLTKQLNSFDSEGFVRIASFILAYNKDEQLDEKIIDQLLKMSHLFTGLDVLNISKGMQFALENKYKNRASNIWKRMELLNNSLDECIRQELQQNDAKLTDVNVLLRSHVIRNHIQSDENDLFGRMLEYFSKNQLNSHFIKDLSFYLHVNGYLEPDILQQITEYIIASGECVLGTTVEKVLHLCYFLGYIPHNLECFLNVTSKIIIRDQERLTGLTFLQTSLALCYFNHLPDVLIKEIFSVEFLEKLDEELSNCYAKTTYPMRVRDHMMQLNRAVCLDYPESNVPWFHERYIETERNKKQNKKQDYFHKQVQLTLEDILKDRRETTLNVDTCSPYGYHIDFELIHQENQPLKTAIILLKSNAYTKCKKNLKGYFQLKQRHLEILGYNVININYDEWKNFLIQQHCIQYIRNKL